MRVSQFTSACSGANYPLLDSAAYPPPKIDNPAKANANLPPTRVMRRPCHQEALHPGKVQAAVVGVFAIVGTGLCETGCGWVTEVFVWTELTFPLVTLTLFFEPGTPETG